MPTFTQLEYIIAVAKYGNFGRAAKHCHVAQPSLSNQIRKAETELGVTIFDRSQQPVLITDVGKELIEQSRVVLREVEKLQFLASANDTARGQFSLGVIPTLSPYLLPLFVHQFAVHHPDVQLKIVEAKTEDIIEMLIADEIDGGLLVTPLKDDRLVERLLFEEPFCAFVSSDSELAKHKKIKFSDLSTKNAWLLDEGHCFRDQMLHLCALGKTKSPKNKEDLNSHIQFTSGSLETIKQLVKRGSGYTLLPQLATIDLSKKDKQRHLRELQTPTPTREVSLVHSRSFYKEKILDALVEEIIAELPEEVKSIKRRKTSIVPLSPS